MGLPVGHPRPQAGADVCHGRCLPQRSLQQPGALLAVAGSAQVYQLRHVSGSKVLVALLYIRTDGDRRSNATHINTINLDTFNMIIYLRRFSLNKFSIWYEI